MATEKLRPELEIADVGVLERAVERLRAAEVVLPTFSQLAEPELIPSAVRDELKAVGPDDPHPLNLFRVHWFNDARRTGIAPVPEHVVLPRELTGVEEIGRAHV